ncbi:hypothetical protein C8R43DRAFT_953085 [Mycena crocata]|nr:hypothetical protein C8R43DRAFT_953085 [Mycena crocata]
MTSYPCIRRDLRAKNWSVGQNAENARHVEDGPGAVGVKYLVKGPAENVQGRVAAEWGIAALKPCERKAKVEIEVLEGDFGGEGHQERRDSRDKVETYQGVSNRISAPIAPESRVSGEFPILTSQLCRTNLKLIVELWLKAKHISSQSSSSSCNGKIGPGNGHLGCVKIKKISPRGSNELLNIENERIAVHHHQLHQFISNADYAFFIAETTRTGHRMCTHLIPCLTNAYASQCRRSFAPGKKAVPLGVRVNGSASVDDRDENTARCRGSGGCTTQTRENLEYIMRARVVYGWEIQTDVGRHEKEAGFRQLDTATGSGVSKRQNQSPILVAFTYVHASPRGSQLLNGA